MSRKKKPRAVDEWIRAVLSPTSRLSPTARLVAVALSRYMDFTTLDDAFPGPARLASDTGLHHRTVQRHLASLTKAGWLQQTVLGGTTASGEQFASTYRGTYPRRDATDPPADDPAPHGTRSTTPRSSATPPSHDPVKDRGHDRRRSDAAHSLTLARTRAARPRSRIGNFSSDTAGVYRKEEL